MRKLYEVVSVAVGRASTFELEDLKRQEGQGAVEYALVVLGVAAVIGVAIGGFGTQIKNFMNGAGTALQGWIP